MIAVNIWFRTEVYTLPMKREYDLSYGDDVGELIFKDFPDAIDLTWQIIQ